MCNGKYFKSHTSCLSLWHENSSTRYFCLIAGITYNSVLCPEVNLILILSCCCSYLFPGNRSQPQASPSFSHKSKASKYTLISIRHLQASTPRKIRIPFRPSLGQPPLQHILIPPTPSQMHFLCWGPHCGKIKGDICSLSHLKVLKSDDPQLFLFRNIVNTISSSHHRNP